MRPKPEIQTLKNNWKEISYKSFNIDDERDDDKYQIIPMYPTSNFKNKIKIKNKVMNK